MFRSTMSFHADPQVSLRLSEIAREDGVTVSSLVRHLLLPGLLLPAVGRRMLRRLINEAGPEEKAELREHLIRALSMVANKAAERRMLADAAARQSEGPVMTEDEIDAAAVAAVEEYRREVEGKPRGPGL